MKKVCRRMRCPNCGSLKTVKNGKRKRIENSFERRSVRKVQRYKCKDCKKSFKSNKAMRERYSKAFKLRLTKMHVEERISYSFIHKRI